MNAVAPDTIDLQTFLKEYERVSSDIRVIEAMNDKVVGFGLTIVGAGFAYGIQQNLLLTFFFLPLGFLGVFFYATLQYHNMFWLGGYKRALEEKINELSERTVLRWEALVETRRQRVNVINASLVSIYLVLLVSAVAYSFARIIANFSPMIAYAFAVVILTFAVLLVISIGQMFRAFARSYSASRELFEMPHKS
jgi:hypothetical protein